MDNLTFLFYIPPSHSSLLCLKRGGVVEADKPVSSQIRSWSLSEGSPYETLHDYVANAFAPYFKAYVKETGKIERWAGMRRVMGGGMVFGCAVIWRGGRWSDLWWWWWLCPSSVVHLTINVKLNKSII